MKITFKRLNHVQIYIPKGEEKIIHYRDFIAFRSQCLRQIMNYEF